MGLSYFVLITSYFLCRHSQKMIDKLENSGLGYYVHSVNTKQKLGISPLSLAMHVILDNKYAY